tara:strand:+ start:1277 stop:2584 length:1308 start_codon:yes stop_codon:yes gene_type:complete
MPTLIDTLFLGALTFLSSSDEPLDTGRADASGELRQAATIGAREDASVRLRSLLSIGERAVRSLGESDQARELEREIFDATCLGLVDPERAVTRIRRIYKRTIADLEFRIRLEAELPQGFPAPTAVGDLEVKRYPAYRRVRSTSGRAAFWNLFRHIESNDIAMTAPVEMTMGFEDDRMRELDMAFLYGTPELGDVGDAGPVEVLDASPSTVISIGCRGSRSTTAVNRARERAQRWLDAQPGYVVAGDLRVMGYNSPMVATRNRYFEVQIPVRRRIVGANAQDEVARWTVVNDSVMGGVSESRIEASAGGWLTFEGTVSAENNGGFASLRTDVEDGALGDASTLRLRFRGDGQRYKLRLRTSRRFDGVSYEAPFDTVSGLWMEIDLPLESFRAVWRGRDVVDAPQLRAAAVTGLGLMISDGQVGSFQIDLDAIDLQ